MYSLNEMGSPSARMVVKDFRDFWCRHTQLRDSGIFRELVKYYDDEIAEEHVTTERYYGDGPRTRGDKVRVFLDLFGMEDASNTKG